MSSLNESIVGSEGFSPIEDDGNRPPPVSKDTPSSINRPEIPPKPDAKFARQDLPPRLNIEKRQHSESTIVTAQPVPAADMDIFAIGETLTEAFDEHLGEAFAIGKKAHDSKGKIAKGDSQWQIPWFAFWAEPAVCCMTCCGRSSRMSQQSSE
jgi:hypothetical protein